MEKWRKYDSIANALDRKEIKQAMLYADSALQLAKEHRLEKERNLSYLNLATLSSISSQYDTSFYYARKAVDGFRRSGNPVGLSKALNRTAINHQYLGNYPLALQTLDSSLRVLETNGLKDSAANTLENISNNHIYLAQYERSLHYALKALALRSANSHRDTVESFMNLGIIYSSKGDYPTSLDHYKRALIVREAQADSFKIHQIGANIGILYRQMRLYENSEKAFTAALGYFERNDFKKIAGRTHNNLGNLYQETDRVEKAKFHFEKALEIEKQLGSEQDLWVPHLNLGYFYEANKEFETAKAYFQKALELSEATGNQYGSVLCNINISACYSEMGNSRKAVSMITGSDPAIRTIDDLSFQQYAFYKCYTIYERAGLLNDALQFFKSFVSVKDSLINEQKIVQIAEIESKHEIVIKDNEIALVNAESQKLEATNKLISTQRKALTLLVFGLLTVLALMVGAYKVRMKKRQLEFDALERDAAQAAKDIANKNMLLRELRTKVSSLESLKTTGSNSEFLNLFKWMESTAYNESDWAQFQERFSKLHPTFLQRLQDEFSGLTDNDLRLAALIRLRMTSKEIASAINIEYVSVQKARYRLKKKLGIDQELDLAKFLCAY